MWQGFAIGVPCLLAGLTVGVSAQEPWVATAVDEPFAQQVAQIFTPDEGLPSGDVRQLVLGSDGTLYARTGLGWAAYRDDVWRAADAPELPKPAMELPVGSRIAVRLDGAQAAAAGELLFRSRASEPWQRLMPSDGRRSWAPRDVRDVAFDDDGGLWFASPQGVGRRSGDGSWRLLGVEDGLPYDDLTAVEPDHEGGVWLGTTLGAIHFDGREWAYRQGRRWLPGDQVRDVLVAPDGAVWIATDGGVSRIGHLRLTLAEKARHFEAEIDRYHRRTPYEFVDSVRLAAPGERGGFTQRTSDNDGLWTGMYGASQVFAYAATGDEVARRRARQAFVALRFLGEVTQGGSPPAQPGFVARSILPTDGPDPNPGLEERDRQRRAERDRLWKEIAPRWPKSADGRWYWKCDTSSDELDGHFFFYALYYDLVARSEAERDEVRAVVRAIVDHLMAHDYALVDHDGRPTRWAVFGPRQLNHDPDWWEERGLNSLSLLSYLRVAEHVTGDARYGEAAGILIDQHAYAANVRVPKQNEGPGTGNQSDDEMAFMSFYNLLAYERDPQLRRVFLHSFWRYWRLVAPERNPLFHFLYAAHGRGESYEDAFGSQSLDPGREWLSDSLDTLRRYPLDRIDWGLRNSHRLDLAPLPGDPARGARRDGKVLPIDERFVDKWNHDPWRYDYAGEGRALADGASYLLPYYLGRYLGFIVPQEEALP